ncbi:MAG TPA: response regulator [Thermodesulfobacteriota bacterium]|nr:response regulator [Thermodesulfobacteriota bacterium]
MMNSKDILLIDPFKNLLNIYRMFLEREKYRIETASNLKDASQKLSLDRYAVMITEFLPPFEETFQMLHWVKEHSPETYIIIVTNSLVDDKTYEELFLIGVDDLIVKPFSPGKILVHVKKGFRNRDLIIKMQELERESLVDPIARQMERPVFNPSYFRRYLRQELKRAKRHRHPLSLLLLEIPGKAVAEGPDESFCIELIRILRNNTREEDIVGRGNGGFGILLPETDEVGSQTLVKRLLQLIQGHSPFQKGENLRSLVKAISFEHFTYPEKFLIPETLRSVLEEISLQYPRP